jgi:hypothetical protein
MNIENGEKKVDVPMMFATKLQCLKNLKNLKITYPAYDPQ